MGVNRYKLRINQVRDGDLDRALHISIPHTTDEMGRGDLIKEYEDETLIRLLNLKKDYEVVRYTHAPDAQDPSPNIFYDFNLGTIIPPNPPLNIAYNSINLPGQLTTWNSIGAQPCPDQILAQYTEFNTSNPIYLPSQPNDPNTWYGYDAQEFTAEEVYRNEKSFVKSFFKLDLYDSPIRNKQKLYISIILNPINGEKVFRPTFSLSCPIADSGEPQLADGRWNCKPLGEADVPRPKFNLDPFNNNDGYYIYWLKDKTFIDISEFYMSCKFYNGKTGIVTSFITSNQTILPNPYSFSTATHFYYKIKLNRNDYTYTVYNINDVRVGTTVLQPIKYWQYFNAP